MAGLVRTCGIVAGTLLAFVCAPMSVNAQSAERLYRDACDAGDAASCNVFALMLETGSDVPRDLALAATLYERACSLGAFAGCANLGLMHETGTGAARDIDRARMLHAVACQGGEPIGCERLQALTDATAATAADATFRRGRVRHASTGAPLGETLITVGDAGVTAISDADGFFTIPPLSPGEYPLRADRVGYEVTQGRIQFPYEADLLILMTPSQVADFSAPGRVEGRVSTDSGEDLRNVEVSVVGQPDARALTDNRGRFIVSGVAPGTHDIQFALLGYAQRSVTLVVHPERTTEVDAVLSTEAIELEPIQVVVRSGYLERNGFYQRQRSGWGRFFDQSDIEDVGATELSDVLRRVPGVRISRSGFNTVAETRRSISWGLNPTPGQGIFGQGSLPDIPAARMNMDLPRGCELSVYVDGVPTFESDLDWIPVSQIEAVEVYTGGISTPMMFTVGSATCGAVAVWTRR